MASSCFLFIILAIFLAYANAQSDGPLEVSFRNLADRYVELGAEVEMEYDINRTPLFAFENLVYMKRIDMKDGAEVETELADGVKLTENGLPEFYQFEFDKDSPTLAIKFKILNVRDVDDGKFRVHVIDKANNEEASAIIKVIVLRDNDRVQMKFGDSDFFSGTMGTPFEEDAGTYSVTCQSEGSNPATEDLTIFWKGEEVKGSAVSTEKMSTPLAKYRSTVTAEVKVEVADSGEFVECVARSKIGTQLATKAPIKVNVYDPDVQCTDNSGYVGKRYLILSCVVTESGHAIESYAYEHGKTGEIILVDTQNKDYDEVIKEDLGNSKVRVDLKLHRVKDSHFSEYYLVITQKNGHVTKRPVMLTEVEGPKDSSSITSVSLITFVLCAICAIWETL